MLGKMVSDSTKDNPLTQAAFVFAVLFVFHVMLIPVLFGFQTLSPFATDQSLTAAFPVEYLLSAVATLILTIVFLVASGFNERSKGRSQ